MRKLGAIILLAAAALTQSAASPPYRYLRAGAAANVRAATRGGFALIGGGTDLDQAFQWMCERSGHGDFLILRASGTDAYNPYVQKLCPDENSVATLILPSRAAALDPFAARTIRAAGAIFLAGGDQSNYVNYWADTPVQKELNDAIRRGVPLGGTSAGLAVLGEWGYSAQHDRPDGPDLTSAVALANPYQDQVVLAHDFVRIPALRGIVTDTHFHNRNRLGRLLVFLARILQDNPAARVHGIGVDQHTALLVEPSGAARAAGTGAVYLFSADHPATLCRAGAALEFHGIAVRRLRAGDHFDLHAWAGSGTAYTLDVSTGTVRSTQPGGDIY
ncbi:MAG TPA: cyanophycinase [Terriglobales bacterium]|nr:cyanophycinase [Terriglobales bacterium]